MPKDRVEAVDRALTLLEAFREPGEELSLAELSERTGFYKSTILRLTGSLQAFGYLLRHPSGDYRLGSTLWRLGTLYRRDFLPAETVRPILRDLAEATGETASFYVRDGDERICLYRLNAKRALRHHLDEGARLPLDRGAAGRLLSAYANDPDEAGLAIRSEGYAVSLGERDPDVGALAVPVFTAEGTCAGALTISGPVVRLTPEMLAKSKPILIEAADALARQAGSSVPQND